LFKALSVAFEGKLFFGVVRKEEESVLARYGIKEFPKIVVVKTTEKKTIHL